MSFRCPACGSKDPHFDGDGREAGCDECGKEAHIVDTNRRIDRFEKKGRGIQPSRGRDGLTLEDGLRYLGDDAVDPSG